MPRTLKRQHPKQYISPSPPRYTILLGDKTASPKQEHQIQDLGEQKLDPGPEDNNKDNNQKNSSRRTTRYQPWHQVIAIVTAVEMVAR